MHFHDNEKSSDPIIGSSTTQWRTLCSGIHLRDGHEIFLEIVAHDLDAYFGDSDPMKDFQESNSYNYEEADEEVLSGTLSAPVERPAFRNAYYPHFDSSAEEREAAKQNLAFHHGLSPVKTSAPDATETNRKRLSSSDLNISQRKLSLDDLTSVSFPQGPQSPGGKLQLKIAVEHVDGQKICMAVSPHLTVAELALAATSKLENQLEIRRHKSVQYFLESDGSIVDNTELCGHVLQNGHFLVAMWEKDRIQGKGLGVSYQQNRDLPVGFAPVTLEHHQSAASRGWKQSSVRELEDSIHVFSKRPATSEARGLGQGMRQAMDHAHNFRKAGINVRETYLFEDKLGRNIHLTHRGVNFT
eukprot:UC4_evm1s1284